MEDLKQCFISSTDREYVEGKVNLFQQILRKLQTLKSKVLRLLQNLPL